MRGEEQCYLVHRLLMCVCGGGGGGSKCVINILGSDHLVFKSCTYPWVQISLYLYSCLLDDHRHA